MTWLEPEVPSWADVLAMQHRIGEHKNFGTKYCPLCKKGETNA